MFYDFTNHICIMLVSRQPLYGNNFKFRKYSNNVIKKAKEFDNSMIITILMSPDKRYSTL